jgi:hypothetical protein
LLNIEPNYIKSKLDRNLDAKISSKQKSMAKLIIAAMEKRMNNEQRRR